MVLWWQPEQERVIAPSVRGVMRQALEALEASQEFTEASANGKVRHGWGNQLDDAERAINALREAMAAPQNQLDDIDVADIAAPNSVEIDGIKTDPAQQEPVAAVIGFYEGEREPRLLSWNRLPNGEHWLYATPQPAPQQAPDALHLAAIDLARMQHDRIAELEAEIQHMDRLMRASVPDRWKACTSPVGSVQSYIAELEQQLAARVRLTDDQMHEVRQTSCAQLLDLARQWADNKIHVSQFTNEAEKIITSVARRVEADHGITKDPA
jgi:hypothetical protein